MPVDIRDTKTARELEAERLALATTQMAAEESARAEYAETIAASEAVRADVTADQNRRQAVHLNEVRGERDFAATNATVANARANNSTFWLYSLLGLLAVGGLLWFLMANNRAMDTAAESNAASGTPVTVRERPVPAPANSRTQNANSGTPVPAPASQIASPPAPTPAPAPRVIERQTVVERPVYVPVPAAPAANSRPAAPTSEGEAVPAPNESPASSGSGESGTGQPLRGYVEPESGATGTTGSRSESGSTR